MEYDNTNRFTLWFESNKQTDKHPDFTGTINIDGKEYFLSGWDKQTKTGKSLISGSVKPKDQPKEKTGFEKAQETYRKIAHKDTVAEIPEEEVDLSSIPF